MLARSWREHKPPRQFPIKGTPFVAIRDEYITILDKSRNKPIAILPAVIR